MSEEFTFDRIYSLTPKKVAVASTCILDKIQHLTSAEQVIGSAAVFILICARFRINNFSEILGRAHNYVFCSGGLRPEFKGIERYLKEILK